MVEKDISQRCFSFWSIKSGQVNACISKGLVCGCEQGERSGSLQCFKQFCLDDTGYKRVVNARALSRSWNVVGGVGGRENLVDHVNHTIAGGHVR